MKRLLIGIAILAVFALGFTVGASTAIRTAEYWSDGEYEDGSGFYEIGYFGGLTIYKYGWEELK